MVFSNNCFITALSDGSKEENHAESSSSQSQFDRHQFPSVNKSTLFHEQFANRTVESERVTDDALLGKAVCRSITNRNWDSLLKFNIREVYPDWVREFYCNMELVSFEDPDSAAFLKTFVRGKWLTITTTVISEFLNIQIPDRADYPLANESHFPVNFDEIGTLLCGEETPWPSGLISHGTLTEEYRFLN